jgi:hypothetical protein
MWLNPSRVVSPALDSSGGYAKSYHYPLEKPREDAACGANSGTPFHANHIALRTPALHL